MPLDSMLRPILNTVLDAVVVIDRDGTIQAWNSHAEEIFGWPARDAIGRSVEIIIPPSLRLAHRTGLHRFNSEGVARVLDQRLELTGVRRDGSEFPVELSITLLESQGADRFVGFLRDISERRKAQAQLEHQLLESRLLFELSELASREGSFEDALQAALDAICELAGWEVGHAFLTRDDGQALQSSAWSSGAREAAGNLVRATEECEFDRGVGMPGRVLESSQPLWVARIDKDSNFPRRGLGFESAFAFPVFSADRCIAVLEFFSRDSREPDPALILSVRAIGAQVGRVHERKRNEELRAMLVAEIDHRARNILAMVRGVARLSFSSAADLAEAQRTFDERLDSIASANAALREGRGYCAHLGEIVAKALAGCGVQERRVSFAGPDLAIDSSSTIMLSLAVHELCTNAFKYGALSNEVGSVRIRWAFAEEAGRFDFEWAEEGGPPAGPSKRKGFGSRILRRGVELATGGTTSIEFSPKGLRYRLQGARHERQAAPKAAA